MIVFVDSFRNVNDKFLIEQCIFLLKDFLILILVDIVFRINNLGCDQNVILVFIEVLFFYDFFVYIEDDIMINLYFYDCMC